ncbi:MAG: hypothetical protein JEZ04_15000 [Spirochaetales bacterium]|nr:hypothetical protein [Spirochaetales bacterium]
MRVFQLRLLAAAFLPLLFLGCGLFGARYTLTLSVENETGGQITADPQSPDYLENTIVSLSAVPSAGWELDSWSGVTSYDGESSSVLMDANRTVTAVFKPLLSRSNPTDGISNPPVVGFAPDMNEKWTFMIYLDGDNNLEDYALLDFEEMEKGLKESGNSANMNIIVLFDRKDDGALDTQWTDSRFYKIVPDVSDGIDSTRLYPPGFDPELNMADPETLTGFLKYCRDEYPAEHYALMFWNHGGGARSIATNPVSTVETSRHICEDVSSPGDYLFTDEIQQAVSAAFPGGIDVISMDACVMGTVEAAYEFRDLAHYYVASMSNVNAYGWDYADLFGRMTSGGSGSEDLAALMVDSYRNSTSSRTDQSLAAIKTSGLSALKTRIDLLASVLYSADKKVILEDIRDNTVKFFNEAYEPEVIAQPYYDLSDFCYMLLSNEAYLSAEVTSAARGVLAGLEAVVLSAYGGSAWGNYYGSGTDVKRGLSIFFSNGERQYNNASHYAKQYWYTALDCSSRGPYGFIDFCTSDEDGIVETWRELMEAWYDPFRPPVGFTPGCW